jgi:hypothetical protein
MACGEREQKKRFKKPYRPLPCSPAASTPWPCLSCGAAAVERRSRRGIESKTESAFPLLFSMLALGRVFFCMGLASKLSLSPLFFSQGIPRGKLPGSRSLPSLGPENGGPGLASVTDALSRARGGSGLRDDGVREVRTLRKKNRGVAAVDETTTTTVFLFFSLSLSALPYAAPPLSRAFTIPRA